MLLSKLRKKSLIKSKSNYDTLCRNLNAICSCLDTIYSINEGGCCYMAYVLANLLEKDNISFRVLVDNDGEDLPEYFGGLNESVAHVCIEVNGNVINDLEGSRYTSYSYVTAKDILNYYETCLTWNSIYDRFRNKFIKYVTNLLYENFSSPLRKRRSNSSSK